MSKRTATAKPEAADTPNPTGYVISKPSDQYVVKLGGSVVFSSPSADKCEEYVGLVTRK